MDELDYKTIQALSRCSFPPGTWVKRFVGSLAGYPPERALSEKQREALSKVAWTYRRQLGAHGIAVTTKPAAIVEEERREAEAAAQAEREKLKAWNEGKPL